MPLTDYVGDDLTELKVRVNATTVAHDTWLTQVANTAAQLVDKNTRGYIPGYLAFSASASETRYFDDYNDGIVLIDDALTITAITRGGIALDSGKYKGWPYNRGNGPWTRVYLRGDDLIPLPAFIGGTWYDSPLKGVGAGQIGVTGTWGYCTKANRPEVVKEATLLQAEIMYEFSQLSPSEIAAAQINPWEVVAPRVAMLLKALKKD